MQNRRSSPSGPAVSTKTTAAIDHGDVTAVTVKEASVTVSGLRTTDMVTVNPPAALAGNLAVAGAHVSAANTLTVALSNPTASTITAGSNTWSVCIHRFTE